MLFLLVTSALAMAPFPEALPGGSCRHPDGTCEEGWGGAGLSKTTLREVCEPEEYSPDPCPRALVFGACVGPTWRSYFTIGNRRYPHPDAAEKNCHGPMADDRWTWAPVPARREEAIAAATVLVERVDAPFSCRSRGVLGTCAESLHTSREDAREACDDQDEIFVARPCPRARRIGSCLVYSAVMRLYANAKQTVDEQARFCTDIMNGVFVPAVRRRAR